MCIIQNNNVIDIKIIIDFVPNHTSDKHIWFQKSANKDPDYADYYIWVDAKNQEEVIKNSSIAPIVPNNWVMYKIELFRVFKCFIKSY